MAWRAAKAITQLQRDMDAKFPGRTKPDWLIGDEAHQTRDSDHNAWVKDPAGGPNVVTAIDIREGGGLEDRKIADALVASRDLRIKYVISERRIASSYVSGGAAAWTWRPYSGKNPHATHCHLSVQSDVRFFDHTKPWDLSYYGGVPLPKPPEVSLTNKRREMGRTIVGYEYSGPLKVFIAPDGNPEIAGVTKIDHPEKYAELKALLDQGKQDEARNVAADYVIEYSTIAALWTDNLALEFFLRDCVFNRGPTGAANILQIATRVKRDGVIGPKTKAALQIMSVDEGLAALRAAREKWEAEKYRRGPGHPQYNGLVNRWNKAMKDADQFKGWRVESGILVAVGGTTVAAGAAIVSSNPAVFANPLGSDNLWSTTVPLVLIAAAIVAVVVTLIRRRSK